MSTSTENPSELKMNFINTLSKMADNAYYGKTVEIFYQQIFELCRHQHLDPLKYAFSPEETTKIKSLFVPAMEKHREVHDTFVANLTGRQIYSALLARSAIQFLIDDFDRFWDEDSKAKYMINPDAEVDNDLEDNIENYALYDNPNCDIPDLAGVPESHGWWTQYHREGQQNPGYALLVDKQKMPWYVGRINLPD